MFAQLLATDSLELITTSSSSISYTWGASDIDGSGSPVLDDCVGGDGAVASATTTTIVAAPASNMRRQLKNLSLYNGGAAANTVTVQKDANGTNRPIATFTLQPGESVQYLDTTGWVVRNIAGTPKSETSPDRIDGRSYLFHKVGTAAEAAGQWYFWGKDTGTPSSWVPGTPGMAGRATDGTAAGDAGCLPIPNAASGANYVTGFDGVASAVGHVMLMDWLWVQSGITVTTTTAQTINSVAFPARDVNGTVNGRGCEIGIYASAAVGNAGIVTTITASYTNSAGTAGRTATLASWPATPVVGTLAFMQLAAGDDGVQSIQSITLGTTLTSGTINVFLSRTLCSRADVVAAVGSLSTMSPPTDPRAGVRIYNGACLLMAGLRPATTATNIYGNVFVATK